MIKDILPGRPSYFSFSFSLHLEPLGYKSKAKLLSFTHKKAKKYEGYPGQYENSPYTQVVIGPVKLHLAWKPFDQLYEEEYREKYGSYEPQGETKWDRMKREEKEKRLAQFSKEVFPNNKSTTDDW